MNKKYYSPTDLSRALGITVQAVRYQIKKGYVFPDMSNGYGKPKFSLEAMQRILAERGVKIEE